MRSEDSHDPEIFFMLCVRSRCGKSPEGGLPAQRSRTPPAMRTTACLRPNAPMQVILFLLTCGGELPFSHSNDLLKCNPVVRPSCAHPSWVYVLLMCRPRRCELLGLQLWLVNCPVIFITGQRPVLVLRHAGTRIGGCCHAKNQNAFRTMRILHTSTTQR
ncbi:uncharacterized protein EI90DRAFT_3068099 [Cantharellus anzutake]|uniref:uncharacterized protein n=1 Tax=Cantharellus anzutake TaxID=1750568 RepID=UPI0019081031|nr:uncharacterized protein EI90DRAFT_3068099 [Cantharellus anzutake]KAF8327159.1 hypothetical protein EI90DRAFT_3068099 [Cantharellus anzutake]